MTFLHPFGLLYLKAAGWTFENTVPEVRKCVIIAAPHSSNWDLPFTMATGAALNLKFKYLAKHTIFEPPFGWFFRAMGGIPIDRRSSQNYVETIATFIREQDECALVVAPEGTRSKVDYWRSGFYHIAKAADVPIALGYLDFANKKCGVGHAIYPIGSPQEVMDEIRTFYRDTMAHTPELFSTPRLRNEDEPEAEAEAAE